MSKPEWEKTRDAFDYVNGLRGQGSVGIYGALGDEARRAQQPAPMPVRKRPKKAAPSAPAASSPAAPRPNAFEPETVIGLIFMWVCMIAGIGAGVWVAFTHPDFSGNPFWQRLGGGVFGGILIAGIVLSVLNWAVHVLLPLLFRLALMAAVFGGIVWLIMLSEGKL